MERINIQFTECEHFDDANKYMEDIETSAYAKIHNHKLDYEDEILDVEVDVHDNYQFMKEFKETDSYEFSSLKE